MNWETMLVDRLTESGTPLFGLIGDRVYPLDLPQEGTIPAVTYMVVSDPEQWGLFGYARVQLTAWDTTYAGALAIRDAMRDTLRDYAIAGERERIEQIDVTWSGPAGFDPDLGLYWRDIDAIVLHIRRH